MNKKNLIFLVFLTACTNPKKNSDEEKTDSVKTAEVPSAIDDKKEKSESSLDELVYEATGASKLKNESLARSEAELKGRTGLIRQITLDAIQLMKDFSSSNTDLFEHLDTAKFATKIQESFKKSTTLKQSKVSEYSQSSKKDTLYASLELPLMSGYEIIEKVLTETGGELGFISKSKTEEFRKKFKEFFVNEKKKLLTIPS